MNNITYKYISEITEDEFKKCPVLPFKSEDGRPCILIRNSKQKTVLQKGKTDNIEYHLNSLIDKDGEKHYFHLVCCIKSDEYSKEQFNIAYNYLFKKIKYPMNDIDLTKLITSLEQLFKVTPNPDKTKLQTGVFGELLFLLYIYEKGYPLILNKYHSYFYSKHDIEIDNHNRIEIKSTVKSKRIHTFGHEQLFRKDINVFVASLILEYSQEGITLYDLFEQIMQLITNPEDYMDMGTLKALCGISEIEKGPSFSYTKSIEQIKIFKSEDLPHLEIEHVNGVTEIHYDVDCALASNQNIDDFIKYLNSLTK